MTEPRGASVVIVGGGVTGLSAGWWLARAGVDVLVLEAGIVGWEASGRNGGGATHVYSPLGLEEQRLWPQMDALLGYPTEHMPHRIKVALSDEQLALYRTNAEIAARQGFRTEPLDRQELRELVPIVGDNAIGGLYLHFGGHANPQRTVQAYAWALQDLGGRIRQHTPVTGFRVAGGRVTAVETDAGPVGADTVVLAAGPQTDRLAARLGVHGPARPVARRDDLHRAPAADEGRRRGRQRALRTPDAPREPRLRRRAPRVARRRLALARRARAPRRRSSGTSAAASPSCSPAPRTSASSGAGPGSWRTRRTGSPSSTAWPIRRTSCSPPCRASGSGSRRPPARPSASSSSTASVASPTSPRSGGAASPTRPPTGAPASAGPPRGQALTSKQFPRATRRHCMEVKA